MSIRRFKLIEVGYTKDTVAGGFGWSGNLGIVWFTFWRTVIEWRYR